MDHAEFTEETRSDNLNVCTSFEFFELLRFVVAEDANFS